MLMSHQIDVSCLGSFATCLMLCAVGFETSIFFASCLTFLAGNISRSMLLSLMVLDTNSSSFKKKQICHNARCLQILVGIWQEALVLVLHSTTHLQICYLSRSL